MNHIHKLSISRNQDGSTDITSQYNHETVSKYIVPIIASNPGWGSGHVTSENIWSLPQAELQTLLDATVGPNADSNCWVILDNAEPVGLFQASITTPAELSSKPGIRYITIRDMLINPANSWWHIPKITPDSTLLAQARDVFSAKSIYSSYGIALAPKFQGQRTAYVNELYSLMTNGILFGWTSNPSIVAKHRKIYSHTYYFPLFDQPTTTPEALISIILLCSSFSDWPKENWENLEFGAGIDKYFVEDRGEEYIAKAKQFAKVGTITDLDAKRIEYVLSRKFCASGIISIS